MNLFEEIKRLKTEVIYLMECYEGYGKELSRLTDKLKALKGFDHAYINPIYASVYNPEKY